MKNVCLAAATVLAVMHSDLGNAQSLDAQTSSMIERIVAIVNDGIVLQTELDSRVDTIKGQPFQLPPEEELREQVLESLIVRRIQLQQAERRGIQITDAQLNRALADIAGRNNLSLEQLPAAMEAEGIDYEVYRAEIRDDMIIEQLRQIEVTRQVRVSEREIDRGMEQFRASAASSLQFNYSHILIALPSSPTREDINESRDLAQDVYSRIIEGADFSQMAVAYSSGETALQGGNMGWKTGLEIPTLLSLRIGQLEAGDVTEPVQTKSGFQIFRVNEIRGGPESLVNESHLRHILVVPSPALSPDSALQKAEELRQRIIDGEDFAEIAIEYSDDPGSGSNGGDLGWNSPGAFVPQFETAAAELEFGQISEVVSTPFGYHIIEVLDRRERDNTEEMMREQVAQQLRIRKLEEETQNWLRSIRDSAYVEIRL